VGKYKPDVSVEKSEFICSIAVETTLEEKLQLARENGETSYVIYDEYDIEFPDYDLTKNKQKALLK